MRLVVAYAREGRREMVDGVRGGDTRLAEANLTPAGVQEALGLGRLAAQLPIGGVLTSPGLAAHQTGQVIQHVLRGAGTDAPLTTHRSLIDVGFVVDEDSRAIQRQGETYTNFSKRIKALHRQLHQSPPPKVLLIVTHQKVIGASLQLATGSEYKVKPGTLSVVTYDEHANATLLALSTRSFSKADIAEVQRLLRPSSS